MCLIYREDLERALSQWDINENFKTIGEVLECVQGSTSDDPITYGINVNKIVNTGGEWIRVDFITEVDYEFTFGIYPAYYVNIEQNRIISYVDTNNLYYIVLPIMSEAISANGMKWIVTIKGYDGAGVAIVAPHPSDVGAKIITTGASGSELNMTGGNQRSFITDGTNWHTINF